MNPLMYLLTFTVVYSTHASPMRGGIQQQTTTQEIHTFNKAEDVCSAYDSIMKLKPSKSIQTIGIVNVRGVGPFSKEVSEVICKKFGHKWADQGNGSEICDQCHLRRVRKEQVLYDPPLQ